MKKKSRLIYLDHAATTPTDPRVVRAMMPFFNKNFGNPSALYQAGVQAHEAIESARKAVANIFHSQPDTVVFTSGGTESDNLAVLGTALAHENHGRHIISIGIEHDAVLAPLQRLKKRGFDITFIPVDKNGLVNPQNVYASLRPDTILVTIMYANNEIGTIEPIADIGRLLLRFRKEHQTSYPFFHSDACQAAGYLDLDVEKLHVDLLTVNGSKIYGPKGVGCLYIRRGLVVEPRQLGGSHENGRRAGTENVPAIVGFSKALELATQKRNMDSQKQRLLSHYFEKKLQSLAKDFSIGIHLNGPPVGESRLPNNINVGVSDIEGEALVIYLDAAGIACSTGSACSLLTKDPSHVLKTIGTPSKCARSVVRFTLGRSTTRLDIDTTIKALKNAIQTLRPA